jgi:hypothetical protein
MANTSQRHEDDATPAPAKLVAAIRELHHEPVFVPPSVDAAVLARARRQLAPTSRRPLRGIRWLPWLAAATAAGVILLGVRPGWFSGPSPQAIAREDLDHNGRVDILDAFALARHLERGLPSEPQFDVNRDGVVDREDVEAIAARAVSLDRLHKS